MTDADNEEVINTVQNNINRIILRPARLNINTNMASLADIKTYTEMIPTYEGDIMTLNNFIETVDETYVILNTLALTASQKMFAFNLVKNKLVNNAKKIVSQNKFLNWEELKLHLTTNFADKTTADTLLLELFETKYKQNTETTLKLMLSKFEIYKSKILAKHYSLEQKNAILQENQKAIINKFISLLPPIIKGSFIVKQPNTLEQCELLLKNEFSYANMIHNSPLTRHDTTQHANAAKNSTPNLTPRQFPGQYFPSQPINFNKTSNMGPNRFKRQNIVNSTETNKFRPQPMSMQTRSTQPMSSQTIRQNYHNELPNENVENEEQYSEESFEDQICESNDANSFLEETEITESNP